MVQSRKQRVDVLQWGGLRAQKGGLLCWLWRGKGKTFTESGG